jgi:predicted kinase
VEGADVDESLSLPWPPVVVLAGPGTSGKSLCAASHFPEACIASSDRLRAVIGTGEDDITASADAFDLLDASCGGGWRGASPP